MSQRLVVVLAVVLAIAAVSSAHDWLTDPLQRGNTAGNAGALSTYPCGCNTANGGDCADGAAQKTIVAGESTSVEWNLNHAGSNQRVLVEIGGPDETGPWVTLRDEDVYDDKSIVVDVPADTDEGLRAFHWRWNLGNTEYNSCGNVQVERAAAGTEVPASKCPSQCSGKGTCQTNEAGIAEQYGCKCNSGYSGADCATTTPGRKAGNAIIGIIAVAAVVGAGKLMYDRKTAGNASDQPPSYAAHSTYYEQNEKPDIRMTGASGMTAFKSPPKAATRMTGASNLTGAGSTGSLVKKPYGSTGSRTRRGGRKGSRTGSKGSRTGTKGSRSGSKGSRARRNGSKGSRGGNSRHGKPGSGQRSLRSAPQL